MKRVILAFCFLITYVFAFGQNSTDTLNFNLNLQKLYEMAAHNELSPHIGTVVILDGVVAARHVVNADTQEYLAEIEIIQGEWIGLSEILSYRALVLLKGQDFVNHVPARRLRQAHPDEILMNSRILLLAEISGYRVVDNQKIPILTLLQYRYLN